MYNPLTCSYLGITLPYDDDGAVVLGYLYEIGLGGFRAGFGLVIDSFLLLQAAVQDGHRGGGAQLGSDSLEVEGIRRLSSVDG